MSEESTPDRKPQVDPEPGQPTRRRKKLATGLAFGIGSAAIVAALLFANRSKNGADD